METVIEVGGVYRNYGKVEALKDVSFSIKEGEIFGFVGPDGSGKSTLFRIMATLLDADKGNVSVLGYDTRNEYRKIRPQIGYMPGRFSLYQDLSVEENLQFFATIFGASISEHYEYIRNIYEQIAPFAARKAGALSGGMKQKLALCCSVIHAPRILFLDEPTTGVDPVSRKEFWDILVALKKQGMTLVVSTPFMDEARRCDRIALLREGRVLGISFPEDILGRFKDILCPPSLERVEKDASAEVLVEVKELVK